MSMAYLGDQFEVHGGGADLIFPHHESENAQSEGATGRRPFVAFWTHAGMLHDAGEKMSKSLGNLVLVRDLLRDHDADAIRHYLLSHHYRSEVHFDSEALRRSDAAAQRLRHAAEPMAAGPAGNDAIVADRRARFLAAMDDDLDTPAALRELDALAAQALEGSAAASEAVRDLGGRILGLRLAPVTAAEPVEAA